MNWGELAIIPIAIILIGGFLLWEFQDKPKEIVVEERPVPDFASITDVKTKKKTFFEFMLPMVREINNRIWEERQQLKQIQRRLGDSGELNEEDSLVVKKLSKKYRLKVEAPYDTKELSRLLRRVDTIPASLALAQAANESAWGTARFARNGNNYYGIWCWSENCGLVPKKRDAGATHEVTAFESVDDSVSYYMLTLNSHPAYQGLRGIRATLRENKTPLRGYELAEGLLMYSERREAYVEEIQAMIDVNDLREFNQHRPD